MTEVANELAEFRRDSGLVDGDGSESASEAPQPPESFTDGEVAHADAHRGHLRAVPSGEEGAMRAGARTTDGDNPPTDAHGNPDGHLHGQHFPITDGDENGGVEGSAEPRDTPREASLERGQEGRVGVPVPASEGAVERAQNRTPNPVLAWVTKEVKTAKEDLLEGDVYREGVPPVRDCLKYSREGAWAGDSRVLRWLHLGWDWTVGIPGQYLCIKGAAIVRRPSRVAVALLLVVLFALTVKALVPQNPVFGLLAAVLEALAGWLH